MSANPIGSILSIGAANQFAENDSNTNRLSYTFAIDQMNQIVHDNYITIYAHTGNSFFWKTKFQRSVADYLCMWIQAIKE